MTKINAGLLPSSFPSESPQTFIITAKDNLFSETTPSVDEAPYHYGNVRLLCPWEQWHLSLY